MKQSSSMTIFTHHKLNWTLCGTSVWHICIVSKNTYNKY